MNRRTRRMTVVLAVAGVIAGATVATPAQATGTRTVWVQKHLCRAPGKGHASCLAVKLVRKIVPNDSTLQPAGVRPNTIQHPGPAGGYSPTDLAAMYGVNASAATTQTVAIVDAYNDPNVTSDLNAFDAQYGLPAETATSFKVVNQSGNASPLPPNDAGWAGEITLDVQAVRGLCHKCKIILVEATSNSFANLSTGVNTAVTLGAKIVSNSYGGPEAGSGSLAAAYNHPNVAITASTGDDGMYDWDNFNEGGTSANMPQVPAAFNTVIAVSGTSLYQNPDGTRQSEQVWNENGPADIWGFNLGSALGAAGGGCSKLYTPRAWQSTAAGYKQLGCAGKRSVTDIAAIADPYTGYDIYDTFQSSGWQTFGGTSLASPVIAALIGLAGGPHGVSYPAQTMYQHFAADAASTLYDVSLGGTGLCGNAISPQSCYASAGNPNTLGAGIVDCAFNATGTTIKANRFSCQARPGYDGASGVGTPNGLGAFIP
jgi:hypothetical protein